MEKPPLTSVGSRAGSPSSPPRSVSRSTCRPARSRRSRCGRARRTCGCRPGGDHAAASRCGGPARWLERAPRAVPCRYARPSPPRAVPAHLHARGLEHAREVGEVGVERAAREDLVADGDEFDLHDFSRVWRPRAGRHDLAICRIRWNGATAGENTRPRGPRARHQSMNGPANRDDALRIRREGFESRRGGQLSPRHRRNLVSPCPSTVGIDSSLASPCMRQFKQAWAFAPTGHPVDPAWACWI